MKTFAILVLCCVSVLCVQVAAHVENIYDLRCQSSSSEMLADIAGNTDADEDTVCTRTLAFGMD